MSSFPLGSAKSLHGNSRFMLRIRSALALGVALLAAGCGDHRPLAPRLSDQPLRDVEVTDPTGSITLTAATYQGASISSFGADNACNITYLLTRLSDGSGVLSACPQNGAIRNGLQAGDYRVDLRYTGVNAETGTSQNVVIASATVTLPTSGAVTVPALESKDGIGLASAAFKVNGTVPPDARYSVCLLNAAGQFSPPGGCSSVRGGRFTIFVAPGAGSLQVRGPGGNLDNFTFIGQAGQTVKTFTTAGGENVSDELSVVDPTGIVTLNPATYLGASIGATGADNACNVFQSLTRLSDGLVISNNCSLSFVSRLGLQPGDYRDDLRYTAVDGSTGVAQSITVASSTVTLPPGGSVTAPTLESSTGLGLLSGSVTVNGQPPSTSYSVCLITATNFQSPPGGCTTVRSGKYTLLVAPGAGSFQVRGPNGTSLGNFTFVGEAGKTVTAPNADVADATGTLNVSPAAYLGVSSAAVGADNFCNLSEFVTRLSDGVSIFGFCSASTFSRAGLTAGDYRIDVRYPAFDPATGTTKQVVIATSTVAVPAGGAATVQPIETKNGIGLLSGALKVNGATPPNGLYQICLVTATSQASAPGGCTGVRSGQFTLFVAPGPCSFQVRGPGGILGNFTCIAAAGQTVVAGNLQNGTPGATQSGQNVDVQPVNGGQGSTNTTVSLTFSNVTGSGITTVTQSTQGPPPPDGLKLGTPPIYYDLTTTANYTGTIHVCINYTGTTFNNPDKLELLHGDGLGNWTILSPQTHDKVNRIICGDVSSFSPFVVAERVEIVNHPPTVANLSTASGEEGSSITFNAMASDPDGDILTYEWDVNDDGTVDGRTSSGTAQFVFADEGSYTVRLTVRDPKGLTATATTTATVRNAAPVVSAGTATTITSGDVYTLDGAFTDAGVGDGPWQYTIDWGDGSATESHQALSAGTIGGQHRYLGADRAYTVRLSVTDVDGATRSADVAVTVKRLTVGVDIKPFNATNSISLQKDKSVPVAILSSSTFDATKITLSTVTLGDGATPETIAIQGWSIADVNMDGRLDVIVTFATPQLQSAGDLTATTTKLILNGTHQDGRQFTGQDNVTVVK